MAFRIKDLMITVLPPGGDLGCAGSVLGGCLMSVAGCLVSACPDIHGSFVADCTPYASCDAGCSRIQSRLVEETVPDLRAAELVLLKAQLMLALQRGELQQRVARVPEQPKTVQEIDLIEKHLQEALKELRGERERFAKVTKE